MPAPKRLNVEQRTSAAETLQEVAVKLAELEGILRLAGVSSGGLNLKNEAARFDRYAGQILKEGRL